MSGRLSSDGKMTLHGWTFKSTHQGSCAGPKPGHGSTGLRWSRGNGQEAWSPPPKKRHRAAQLQFATETSKSGMCADTGPLTASATVLRPRTQECVPMAMLENPFAGGLATKGSTTPGQPESAMGFVVSFT